MDHLRSCVLPSSAMAIPTNDGEHPLAIELRAFIKAPDFPCVGAKSAIARGQLRILVARDIASGWDDMRIYPALLAFICRYRARPDLFQSFAVIFEGPDATSEEAFERHLWARAQSLSDKDGFLGQRYDASVDPDPENPHFSLSFGGEAVFLVGLHPGASRPARRFSRPVIVFNLRAQFEQLRQEGRYETLRSSILSRDVALAGSMNPMIARHGEASEARQYSGRAVGEDWACPFKGRDISGRATSGADERAKGGRDAA